MILTDRYKRIILWGATIKEDHIKAELAFWGSGLGNKTQILELNEKRIAVELPDNVLNLFQPSKSQRVTLNRV